MNMKNVYLFASIYCSWDFINNLFGEIPYRNPFLLLSLDRCLSISLNKVMLSDKIKFSSTFYNCIFLIHFSLLERSPIPILQTRLIHGNQYHSSSRNFPLTWECHKSGIDVIGYRALSKNWDPFNWTKKRFSKILITRIL